MASIKVKGTISRVFYEGKGIELTEAYTTKAGETINKRYTVWLKTPTTFDIGQEIQVEGLYSSEIDNWTNKEGEAKQSIKVSRRLNCRIPDNFCVWIVFIYKLLVFFGAYTYGCATCLRVVLNISVR